MIYLKSVLVGLAAAVAVVVLCVAALFAFFMLLPYLASWSDTGSGGIGFVSTDTGPLLIVPLVAFMAGFYWKFRSERRAKARL